MNHDYKTLLTRYRLQGNWVINESQNLEDSMLTYRKLLKSRLIKNRPDRYSFQYRFKHQNDWIAS